MQTLFIGRNLLGARAGFLQPSALKFGLMRCQVALVLLQLSLQVSPLPLKVL